MAEIGPRLSGKQLVLTIAAGVPTGRIEAAVSGYNKDDRQVEHALVRLGVKIDGITLEDARKDAKPSGEGKSVPAMGLK